MPYVHSIDMYDQHIRLPFHYRCSFIPRIWRIKNESNELKFDAYGFHARRHEGHNVYGVGPRPYLQSHCRRHLF